jgi:hypothetical protein
MFYITNIGLYNTNKEILHVKNNKKISIKNIKKY